MGRPRQARPRDELGRPLPYNSVGVPPVPEQALPAAQTIALARELVEQGRPFSAHEVLEARWKACPPQERDLWQGLAQICVGLTHEGRGNEVGAATLINRGSDRLISYLDQGGPCYGLELPVIIAWARLKASSGV